MCGSSHELLLRCCSAQVQRLHAVVFFFFPFYTKRCWVCVARFWKQGGYRGGFCDKLPKASSQSNGTNSSWLQDIPKADHQQQGQKLWDNVSKKGKIFPHHSYSSSRRSENIFSLSHCDLIGNKLNWFPEVESALPVMEVSVWSLPGLILTHDLFVVFSSPAHLRKGGIEQLRWTSVI